MIKIDRSRAVAPDVLIGGEVAELARLRSIVPNRRPKNTDFDRGLYSSEEIKSALWQMQHRKCCYCEREYERKYSDVEHFRPKAEAMRHDGTSEPGYWWLAYRFDNLYFACPPCNRTKSTHFPLVPGTLMGGPELGEVVPVQPQDPDGPLPAFRAPCRGATIRGQGHPEQRQVGGAGFRSS